MSLPPRLGRAQQGSHLLNVTILLCGRTRPSRTHFRTIQLAVAYQCTSQKISWRAGTWFLTSDCKERPPGLASARRLLESRIAVLYTSQMGRLEMDTEHSMNPALCSRTRKKLKSPRFAMTVESFRFENVGPRKSSYGDITPYLGFASSFLSVLSHPTGPPSTVHIYVAGTY